MLKKIFDFFLFPDKNARNFYDELFFHNERIDKFFKENNYTPYENR